MVFGGEPGPQLPPQRAASANVTSSGPPRGLSTMRTRAWVVPQTRRIRFATGPLQEGQTSGQEHPKWPRANRDLLRGWGLEEPTQGNERASNTAATKAEAQAVGREMAKVRGVEHVIKNKDRHDRPEE